MGVRASEPPGSLPRRPTPEERRSPAPGGSIHPRLPDHPPPASAREYTPARSADKHLPEAHWRSASILSPAVTATGTTFCAAWTSGTSKIA